MRFSSRKALLAVVLAVLGAAMCAGRSWCAGGDRNLERLMEPRVSTLWIDGQVFDDLVLNARGKLTLICIDGKLGRALRQRRERDSDMGPSVGIPSAFWLYANQYGRSGRVLFAAQLDSFKSLSFDPERLSVAGYRIEASGMLTGVGSDPSLEIRPGVKDLGGGYSGHMGFYVPSEYVKPGTEVTISYDGFSTVWRVPAKNQ
ncbi:MAG: hypothetical protein LBS75_07040 [Synergistaceae bacterium]|jgi:hypothetical protein|nr:hypothetical protein [Synergistaceae bacterium]